MKAREPGAEAHGAPASVIVTAQDVPWREVEAGVWHKDLWVDRERDRALVLRRLEAGVRRRRRHRGQELIFVLEGSVSDEWGTATPGVLAYAGPGCAHTETSDHGATLLVHSIGPGIEPVPGPPDGARSERYEPHEMPWTRGQPGTSYKKIWTDPDPDVNRRVVLLRFEAGVGLRHRHFGDELVFVLEGCLTDEAGDVTPGNVAYRPPGCVHTVGTEHGALFLAYALGGSEPA